MTPDPFDHSGQSSPENGPGGTDVPGHCARCRIWLPVEGGEFCGGCRALLLGDTDTDPVVEARAALAAMAARALVPEPERLADGSVQVGQARIIRC